MRAPDVPGAPESEKADGLLGFELQKGSTNEADDPMYTVVPDKLLKVADDIKAQGAVNITRMTVLKKWFEHSDRLPSFAIFIAKRAFAKRGKPTGESAELFKEARSLLAGHRKYRPLLNQGDAKPLYGKLRAFQSEYQKIPFGVVRMISNWKLFLIEKGLGIYLKFQTSPYDGYRLAAQYCEHYNSRYPESLNGPSYDRIHEIVRFMSEIEAMEDEAR